MKSHFGSTLSTWFWPASSQLFQSTSDYLQQLFRICHNDPVLRKVSWQTYLHFHVRGMLCFRYLKASWHEQREKLHFCKLYSICCTTNHARKLVFLNPTFLPSFYWLSQYFSKYFWRSGAILSLSLYCQTERAGYALFRSELFPLYFTVFAETWAGNTAGVIPSTLSHASTVWEKRDAKRVQDTWQTPSLLVTSKSWPQKEGHDFKCRGLFHHCVLCSTFCPHHSTSQHAAHTRASPKHFLANDVVHFGKHIKVVRKRHQACDQSRDNLPCWNRLTPLCSTRCASWYLQSSGRHANLTYGLSLRGFRPASSVFCL